MTQIDLFTAAADPDAKSATDTRIINCRMWNSCQLIFAWLFRRPLRAFWSESEGFNLGDFKFYIRVDARGDVSDSEFSDYIRQRYGINALALLELLTSPKSVWEAWLKSREANLDPKQLFAGLANRELTFKPIEPVKTPKLRQD